MKLHLLLIWAISFASTSARDGLQVRILKVIQNRLLLGAIAFGISATISLMVTPRDMPRSLVTGAISVPAAYLASAIVTWRQYRQAEHRLLTLRQHIRLLQQRRTEEQQALAELTARRKTLSWNLADPIPAPAAVEPPADPLPADKPLPDKSPEITTAKAAPPPPDSEELTTLLINATAAKQRIEASLTALQHEFQHLTNQINDQRMARDGLVKEVSTLAQQQQELHQQSTRLRKEISELERCRTELDQYLAYAETKKRELETGKNPLQTVLKQLQAQINGLQAELHQLEAQVLARRQEKEALEQQATLLKAKKSLVGTSDRNSTEQSSSSPTLPPLTAPNPLPTSVPSAMAPNKIVQVIPAATPTQGNHSSAPLNTTKSTNPTKPAGTSKSAENADVWTEFMVQVPDYEFQALRAIAHQDNPTSILQQIADDNLTTPERLVESINNRAEELLGILILQPGTGDKPPAVVREQLKPVKKLIKTYEYLTE